VLTQNIEMAVIGADLEKRTAGAIPPVDDFFNTTE
jgi:hypothetical protein